MMCGGSFCVWSILVAAAFLVSGLASPSLLRKSTSPKGRGLGKKMKVVWIAKGSPFGGAGKSAGFD